LQGTEKASIEQIFAVDDLLQFQHRNNVSVCLVAGNIVNQKPRCSIAKKWATRQAEVPLSC